MTHPRDLARLRSADQMKEESPLVYDAIKAFVPVLGQTLAAKDYVQGMRDGGGWKAAGEAANFMPGYSFGRAAIAEGPAHVVPAYNAIRALVSDGWQGAKNALAPAGLRRAATVNGQIIGNDARLWDAGTIGQ